MFDTSLGLSENAVRGFYPDESPNAGLPIVPLGFLPNGKAIWPIMGGAPKPGENDSDDVDSDDDDGDDDDDDDDDSDAGDDDDDTDDDADSDDDPEGKKSKKKKDDGKPRTLEEAQRKIDAQQDNLDRFHRVVRKARQERDDALTELQKLKDDGTTDEKLKEELRSKESSVSKLTEDLEGARLEIAFLSDNSYEWVNPGQALKLVDLSEVEFDDDGKVLGLKSALEALATSSPHLLKKRRTVSGTSTTGERPAKKTSSAAKKKATDDAIARKYGINRR